MLNVDSVLSCMNNVVNTVNDLKRRYDELSLLEK